MLNDYSKHSDSDLVRLIQRQNKESEKAFTELYERYSSRLYAYCRRVMNNREQAEDLFQETFYKFYQRIIDSYKEGSVIGFLITIARNMCLNLQRDKKQFISIDEINNLNEFIVLADSENDSPKEEMFKITIAALELLDPEYKDVLVMKYYSNLEYSEIAEVLGTNVNSVRVRVHRAKEKIKTIINDYENKVLK